MSRSYNVALLLSGQARNFADVAVNMKRNVIEPTNCDIFIHVSRDNDFQENKFYEVLGDVGFNYNSCLITRDYMHEKRPEWMNGMIAYEKGGCRVMNPMRKMYHRNILQIYYIEQAWKLMASWPKKYDVVIRSRMDMDVVTELDISELKDNTVHTSLIGNTKEHCCNDRFAFGFYKPMSHYCTRYTGFDGITYDGKGEHIIAESQLAHYLDLKGVMYERSVIDAMRWHKRSDSVPDRETP